ncbi:MAG: hypothetical protein QXX41_06935 [Nitrososphaerota archaeon]
MSIRVRRELVELANKMIRYSITRSRPHAFNIMIEKGLAEVAREVEYWNNIYRRVEELKKQRYKLRHGGLNQILQEGRTR